MKDRKMEEIQNNPEQTSKILNNIKQRFFARPLWQRIVFIVLIAIVVGGIILLANNSKNKQGSSTKQSQGQSGNPINQSGQSSKYYSFTSACQGTGKKTLTTLPINLDAIRSIWPLGVTGGADVIAPEGHAFFFKDLNTPPDSYAVVSPADGVVAMVNEHHSFAPAGDSSGKIYEVMIAHTCTQYSFITTLSSVDPNVKVARPINEGQAVGKAGGGHGFAYGVLDTSSPNHYVVPEHYDAFKLYGKNAFDYFSDTLKAQLEAKSLGKTAPKGGTLEIDRDGKLVGSWHTQGSEGFANQPGQAEDYFKNFLSFGYDFIDPKHLRFSLGDYLGQTRQSGVKDNGPDPASVSVSSGLIKYELVDYHYKNETTGKIEENTDTFDPAYTYKPVNDDSVIAVLLVQLTSDRTLKMEIFPGKTASQVTGFDSSAQIYER